MICAVHDAALALIQERVRSRRCTITSLARLAGLSEPAVSLIVSGKRRAGAVSLSALVQAAYLTRDEVWTAAGVCPLVPRHPVFAGRSGIPSGEAQRLAGDVSKDLVRIGPVANGARRRRGLLWPVRWTPAETV